jgi:molybdate transport system ATP-binding protein
MLAWKNVAFAATGDRGRRRARAFELLESFGVAAERASAPPAELSGGERQRVALARALAREPSVLLLDEPLAALDPATRARAGRELGAIVLAAGVPAVLVTHDFAEAAALAQEVVVIERGRVVQRGTPAALASAPASGFVADFTGASVLTGVARPLDRGLTGVELDGGGTVISSDRRSGPVSVSVQPWEISLEPAGEPPHGSAQNRLAARVVSVIAVGGRVRVALATPQLLSVEVTEPAVSALGLRPGIEVTAAWKATATRLAER